MTLGFRKKKILRFKILKFLVKFFQKIIVVKLKIKLLKKVRILEFIKLISLIQFIFLI